MDSLETKLSGNNLKVLKSIISQICASKKENIGDMQVGFANLNRVTIVRDGCPLGKRGTTYFLCEKHCALVDLFNNLSINSSQFYDQGYSISMSAFKNSKDQFEKLKLENLEKNKPSSYPSSPILSNSLQEGLNYYNGINGFPKDYSKAFTLFENAYSNGDYSVARPLGKCYLMGHGINFITLIFNI